jgi:MFS family permease
VAFSPWIWVALAGWALFGLGLSGCVPQLFSAAGHAAPDAAGTNVSWVAGLGYLGMLTGPAVIGWLTRLVALNYTFLFPALLLVIAAATGGILRSGTGGWSHLRAVRGRPRVGLVPEAVSRSVPRRPRAGLPARRCR